MPKRCECDRLLEFVETAPVMLIMPLAARALWLGLVQAMRRGGASVLRFGSHIPNRSEIALLLSIAETDLEPNLNRLLAVGLLEQDQDGALSAPWLRDVMDRAARRAEVNRINGLKAGEAHTRRRLERERQRELEARQTHLMMPIAGGAAAAEPIAEPKPNPRAGARPAAAASLSESKEASSSTGTITEAEAIARDIAATAGMNAERAAGEQGVVASWMRRGLCRRQIDCGVSEVMARPNLPERIGSLRYFGPIMEEIIAENAPYAAGRVA